MGNHYIVKYLQGIIIKQQNKQITNVSPKGGGGCFFQVHSTVNTFFPICDRVAILQIWSNSGYRGCRRRADLCYVLKVTKKLSCHFELGERNERGDRLIQFCQEKNIIISNTFIQLPTK